jgi:predicted ester cyclase
MKKLICILAILSVTFGFTQDKKSTDLKTVNAYTQAFNSQDFEAIYNLYSAESKTSTTLNQVKAYTERIYNSVGEIKSVSFLNKEANSYNKYDLILNNPKNDVVDLHIKLNKKHEIEGISFNKK